MKGIIPAYLGWKPYIFFSYAHMDKEQSMKIIHWLYENGFRVWYDEGIEFGEDFPTEIATRLENCSQFIVLLSDRSVKRRWVKKEIKLAEYYDRKILPIYLEKTKLPKEIEHILGIIHGIRKYEVNQEDFYLYLNKGLKKDCRREQRIVKEVKESVDQNKAKKSKGIEKEKKEVVKDDFDEVIINYLAEEFLKINGIDLRNDNMALRRLKDAAKNARKKLSSAMITNVSLPFIAANQDGPKHLNVEISRAKLEELSSNLQERTLKSTSATLGCSVLNLSNIDNVTLSGKSTRIQTVQEEEKIREEQRKSEEAVKRVAKVIAKNKVVNKDNLDEKSENLEQNINIPMKRNKWRILNFIFSNLFIFISFRNFKNYFEWGNLETIALSLFIVLLSNTIPKEVRENKGYALKIYSEILQFVLPFSYMIISFKPIEVTWIGRLIISNKSMIIISLILIYFKEFIFEFNESSDENKFKIIQLNKRIVNHITSIIAIFTYYYVYKYYTQISEDYNWLVMICIFISFLFTNGFLGIITDQITSYDKKFGILFTLTRTSIPIIYMCNILFIRGSFLDGWLLLFIISPIIYLFLIIKIINYDIAEQRNAI